MNEAIQDSNVHDKLNATDKQAFFYLKCHAITENVEDFHFSFLWE